MHKEGNMEQQVSNNQVTHTPEVTFKTRVRDESVEGENPFAWKDITSSEIFKGKRVIVVALPGAFTPTCSGTHLPGYEKNYAQLKELGVDEVYCVSVNDAFSMFQWEKQLNVKNVKMLPDGNADFTREMGMLVKKETLALVLALGAIQCWSRMVR